MLYFDRIYVSEVFANKTIDVYVNKTSGSR